MVRPIICVDTILRWQPVNQRVLRTPDCTVHDKSRNRKLTHHSSRAHLGGLPPIRFYKGRSQEKTHLLRPEFFLLLSPLDRASSVLTYRAMCSVAGPCDPVNLDQRFSSLVLDEACQFRNQQSRTVVKFGDHSSIWDSWPIAFSGCPRGTRVAWETKCPRHAVPN